MVMNYKGAICKPHDLKRVASMDYGQGVGSAVTNKGILICGGTKNLWKGQDDPSVGGEVCHLIHWWSKIRILYFLSLVLFLVQQLELPPHLSKRSSRL